MSPTDKPLLPPDEWKERWPDFTPEEVACKHCGKHGATADILDVLQHIRTALGKPLTVSSVYRCPEHPEEKVKPKPGEHSLGLAADLPCHSDVAMRIVQAAVFVGVNRVGVSQRSGRERFIHIGLATEEQGFPVALYSY